MVLLAMDHGRDGTQRRQVAVKRVPLSAKAPGGEWGLMRDLAHPNLLRALDFLPEGTLGFGGAPGPAAAGAEGGEAPAAPSNRQSLLNAVLGGGVGGRAAAGGKTGLLLLEYAPGGPAHRVADAAKALPMPAREAFASSVIRHVLLALAYLHSSRIVHRDVKGANILLFPNTLVSTGGGGTPFSPPPRTAPVAASLSPLEAATFPVGPAQPAPLAKLGDLGVAVRVAAAPDAGSAAGSHAGGGAQPPIAGAGANNNDVAGSVFWMPPEGIRGDVTPAFDIWSCGCTAFELVNGGKPPLHDREWANAMFTILHVVDSGANSLVQLLKDDTSGEILRGENAVSASFLDFLKAALTVDARQRPTATELLRHAWITDHESSMLPFNFPLPSAQGPSGSASTTAPAAVPLPSVQQNGVPHLRRASDNLTALTLEQVISVCAAGSAIAAAAWLEPDMPAPGAGAGDGAHMAPLHAMKRARAKSQARVRDFVKGIEQRADALRTSNVSIASVASVFDALPAPRDDCESAILLDAGLAPSPAAAAAVRDRLTIARALYALAHVVDPQRAVSQHNPQQLQPAAAGSSGTAIANLLADLAAGGFWSTDWDAVFPPPLVALGIARANMGAAIGLGNSLDQALLEGAEARRGYRAIWDDVALALCVLYGASCAHTLLHPPRFACASEGALRLLLASDAHRADALRALLRGVETLANTAPVIARDGDIDAALMASAGGVAEVRAIALSLRRTLPLLCEGAAAALLRAGPDEMRAETARATLDLGAVALLRIAAEGASSDVLLEVLQKDVLWRSLQTALPPRRVAVHVVDLAVRAAHLLPVRELLDRRMLMPTLLQLASAPLSYERSTDLAEVLAHCREHAPQALVGLASQQGVIAHLINVPVPAGCAPLR
jgi:serine/threonine protein kinase